MHVLVPQQVEEWEQREWVGTQEGAEVVDGAEDAERSEGRTWSKWAAARVRPAARTIMAVAEGIAIRICGVESWWEWRVVWSGGWIEELLKMVEGDSDARGECSASQSGGSGKA